MDFIPSLELKTWLMNVTAGDPEIFVAIALFFITGLAGYFRMDGIGLFFMIGVFLLMFSTFISSPLLILVAIFGGLFIGYIISSIFYGRT